MARVREGGRTGPGKALQQWEPENSAFWESAGKRIANRNLWISIPNLMLAFSVWMVWSVVAVNLPRVGFHFTEEQLFWLAALPGLTGATLRIFYSFMVPIFGGRRWTIFATLSLALPAAGIGVAVQHLGTPYWVFAALALLSGLGGANFASSMANISFFFPRKQKGLALGLNGGLGNLGVSLMQFVAPLVITFGIFGALGGGHQTWLPDGQGRHLWLQNAGFIWLPFILLAAGAAWLGMNDIQGIRSSFREQAVIFKRKHNWLMSLVYTGTFGSFIGYSAGLPLLTKLLFPKVDPTQYAFLGPLVGALARPVGGWLADKLSGAKVTFWAFLVMIAATLGVIHFMPDAHSAGNFWGFLGAFLILFATTGVGNGSVFRMIPVICLSVHVRDAMRAGASREKAETAKEPAMYAAAVLGFTSAVAAYGAFFIPFSYGASTALTGRPTGALYAFILFYIGCMAIVWWYYFRRGAEVHC